jgi:hypothetical protein
MDTPRRWTDPQTDNRYYKDEQKEPSVTTILNIRDTDETGLNNWKADNDGNGLNPDWSHLFWYKMHRGTLCHWHALSTLDESLTYSDDERGSRHELYFQNEDEVADSSPREVLYSVLKDRGTVEDYGDFYTQYPPYKNSEYYRKALWTVVDNDIAFFVDSFDEIVRTTGGEERVVERYLLDHEYGFGGQVDLVYTYPDGTTAVCDLKTSSSNRDKNKLQSAAYANAVENDDSIPIDTIDRTEVWRIHPDSGTYTIHSHEKATPLHSTNYWYESMDESWKEFHGLCEQFHDEIDVDAVTEPAE